MAERSKARVYGSSFAGFAGLNLTGVMDVSLVSVVCCQVEVSATGRPLVQRVLLPLVCQCVNQWWSVCLCNTRSLKSLDKRIFQPGGLISPAKCGEM